MNEIYLEITQQFDFLKDFGLLFNYEEAVGKLGDREIKKFIYANPTLQKKIEIVYCTADNPSNLYGFLIKYNSENKDPQDVYNNISFNRLRCFFKEGGDIIFFGNEQYTLSYKLKEFKLIIDKFITCVISNDWVDYNKLLDHERKIYVLTLEPKNHYSWAEDIKSNEVIKDLTTVIYDSSIEPPYETYGLRLKSKNGLSFHITHGYKSRDEDGFAIHVLHPNNKTEEHEFMNTGTNKVVQFIRQMVSA